MIAGGEGKHDGERIGHEVFHDCIADGGVGVLIDRFSGEEIVGMLKLGVAMVNVGSYKEAIAVYFRSIVVLNGVEVVCKELGNDSVGVGLVLGDESADKLRIVLKFGAGEMANGDRSKRRCGEVVIDWSCGVSAVVLATSGGRETRGEVTHVENCWCGVC